MEFMSRFAIYFDNNDIYKDSMSRFASSSTDDLATHSCTRVDWL